MAGDMYLENLDEFLFDEDRVVTYKWLSQTLSVHANQAKGMLESYLEHLKGDARSAAVNVTYLVSGVQEKDNGVRLNKVMVVSGKDLEKTEAGMVEVLSKHVYSIQKAVLKDSNTLYMTDYAITKDSIKQPSRFSAISCVEARPRTAAELEELAAKAGASFSAASPAASPAAKPKMNGNAERHVIESLKTEPKKAAAAAAPPATTAAAGKGKRGQLTSFGGFAASKGKGTAGKPDETKEEADGSRPKKEAPKSAPTGKGKGGMMAFLTSAPAKAREASPPPRQSKATASADWAPSVPSSDRKMSPAESKSRAKRGGKAKRKAARIDVFDSGSEEEKQTSKRRRRIIQPDSSSSSSSSSEDDLSDMEDSPIPPTPPPAPAELISSEDEQEEVAKRSSHVPDREEKAVFTTTPGGKRRRRKRVLRNKTTVDEDGCMVTEKVWENDWTDEDEEPAPPPSKVAAPRGPSSSSASGGGAKKTDEEDGKKKKTSPGSGSGKPKQRSLMSFFTKK